MLDSKQYTGRSSQQVTEYLQVVVKPILERYKADLDRKSELSV